MGLKFVKWGVVNRRVESLGNVKPAGGTFMILRVFLFSSMSRRRSRRGVTMPIDRRKVGAK